MIDDDLLKKLANAGKTPANDEVREKAIHAAMDAFDEIETRETAKKIFETQGTAKQGRLTSIITNGWVKIMNRKFIAGPAIAALLIVPIGGYFSWQFAKSGTLPFPVSKDVKNVAQDEAFEPVAIEEKVQKTNIELVPPSIIKRAKDALADGVQQEIAPVLAPASSSSMAVQPLSQPVQAKRVEGYRIVKHHIKPTPRRRETGTIQENRDRVEDFDSNSVKSVKENPVSTFSVDVDSAGYSLARRQLNHGQLPEPDSVRVEELINYFPYDWPAAASKDEPFKPTVTVTPSPWNENRKLVHIAIKGYEVQEEEKPASNLVFLVDTSGSMNAPDKLPLLKNAFRLMLNNLADDDTVSLVTYAGGAGTVLEPTKVRDQSKILKALDNLQAGGSTAGEAGIKQAYDLAEKSFIKDGVNRVILATDGDFNIGQTSDDALKKLIEDKRKDGVFLSVLGFGQGNYNDQLMQTLAQNGNGTAAYIDNLSEAQKTLVDEASSTLFPIAKDVKIQVEFNPEKIAEYRLIGYETRELEREEFNNDKVDAAEVGSGHSVTAIYEVALSDAPDKQIDDLRYGKENTSASENPSDEYGFLKLRYKLPNSDESELIEMPIGPQNEVDDLSKTSDDVRFSLAVAGFGQKLRNEDNVVDYDWLGIGDMANDAKGDDTFGYRAEFLRLVALAKSLDGQ